MEANPLDWSGPQFLVLFGTLLLVATLAGQFISAWLRPQGQPWHVADIEMLALLAGGRNRHAETVVAYLLGRGAMELKDGKFNIRSGDPGTSTTEQNLLALEPPVKWDKVIAAASGEAARIEQELVDNGLLVSRANAHQTRVLQTAPFLLLLIFGILKWEQGSMVGITHNIFMVVLIVTAFFALLRFKALDRRTRWGSVAVDEARINAKRDASQSERQESGSDEDETCLAVALFGTAALAGSALSPFHKLRKQDNSDNVDPWTKGPELQQIAQAA